MCLAFDDGNMKYGIWKNDLRCTIPIYSSLQLTLNFPSEITCFIFNVLLISEVYSLRFTKLGLTQLPAPVL
jgi:hypothetical protein